MSTKRNARYAALILAIAELGDINTMIAPLIREQTKKKRAVLKALGAVIIQFVEEYGELRESHDKKYWYREMECSRPPLDPGFQGKIDKVFGKLDWFGLYRPALECLDKRKARFHSGMGDCYVVLNEKLTPAKAEAMRKSRLARPSP